METWRDVFRRGVAPQLSLRGLFALRDALRRDDPRLTQGATTTPPPLGCVTDWPCEGACLIGYAGWIGDGLATVGEVESFFGFVCGKADAALNEISGVRHLLDAFDDWPREEMIANLLPEIEMAIREREDAEAA
jgi:hypothetical protein